MKMCSVWLCIWLFNHMLSFRINLSILWALACFGATMHLTHQCFYANGHISDSFGNAKAATYPRCVFKKYNPFNYVIS